MREIQVAIRGRQLVKEYAARLGKVNSVLITIVGVENLTKATFSGKYTCSFTDTALLVGLIGPQSSLTVRCLVD
jgi:hypothetical protein